MAEKNKTIEESFEDLDVILEKMDDEELPLEESFKLYNEGLEIIKYCNEKIEKVESELEVLEKDE